MPTELGQRLANRSLPERQPGSCSAGGTSITTLDSLL